jgi:hypothetical protein
MAASNTRTLARQISGPGHDKEILMIAEIKTKDTVHVFVER